MCSYSKTIVIDEQEVLRLSDGIHRIKESIGKFPQNLISVPNCYRTYMDRVPHFDILPRYIGCSEKEVKNLFDPSVYLKLFDRINIPDGYRLDYVYLYQIMGGRPIVYILGDDERPAATVRDLRKRYGDRIIHSSKFGASRASCKGLSFDKSPEGFLQMAIFRTVVNQFYLYWHAAYDDTKFIFSSSDLADAIRMMRSEEESIYAKVKNKELENARLDELDFTPHIEWAVDDLKAKACMLTYSGEGISVQEYLVTYPSIVDILNKDVVYKYSSGQIL